MWIDSVWVYVDVCALCVGVCVHMCVCVCAQANMWSSKSNPRFHSSGAVHLVFWGRGSQLGTCHTGKVRRPGSHRDPLSSFPQGWDYNSPSLCLAFLCGLWGTNSLYPCSLSLVHSSSLKHKMINLCKITKKAIVKRKHKSFHQCRANKVEAETRQW